MLFATVRRGFYFHFVSWKFFSKQSISTLKIHKKDKEKFIVVEGNAGKRKKI